MECLDENVVLQYVEGLLSPAAEQTVDEHVATCDECRWMLSAAGAAVLDEDAIPTGEATRPMIPAARPLVEQSVARRLHEVLQGTYIIERFIGRGGFGVVYEARHRRLPRRFAVKLLFRKWASDAEAIARLKREAEVTSRLSHPNIVEVVDFNRAEDGTPFLVMELLEGESLKQRLQREGAIRDLAEVARIVQPVASALGAVHAEGIVHRDLKPSNVFLCRLKDGSQQVKVVDFGIAKVLPLPVALDEEEGAPLTRVCAVLGTPSYMSPEQAAGRSAKVDHRADIFALGAIIYRMVSGASPFPGTSAKEVLDRVREVQPVDNEAWRRTPAPLRKVILRALCKRPADRQQSMAALWDEMAAAFAEAGVAVAPEGAGGGFTAEVRPAAAGPTRHLALLAAAGGLVLLGFGLLFLATARRAPTLSSDRGEEGKRGRVVVATADAEPATRDADTRPSKPHDRRDARFQAAGPDLGPILRPRHPTRSRAARKAWGSLVVQTKVKADGRYLWADVYLDGRLAGQTALTLEKVQEGLHHIEVRRQGYLPTSREVRILAGRQLRVRFELERK